MVRKFDVLLHWNQLINSYFRTIKPILMQQEILIMLYSVFAQKHLNEIQRKESKKVSRTEHIAETCVNGLLQEMLPVVFKPQEEHKMYLWQMYSASSFLQFELGEVPISIEKRYSLDPHNFISSISLN
jgi:hypothetical protein